jgi:hypothetical protein
MTSMPDKMMRAHRKSLKPSIGFVIRLMAPVILFHNVVQVLALPNLDRCFPLGIDRLKGRQIRAAFVHRHSFRRAVLVDRFLKIPLESVLFGGVRR